MRTRGDHLATVSRLAHELFVRDEIGELLERAAPEVSGLDPESDDACLVAVATRDWQKARRVPADRAEMTKLSSEGVEAWARRARRTTSSRSAPGSTGRSS